MWSHPKQGLVIFLMLDANQTKTNYKEKKMPIWGVSINCKNHQKIFIDYKEDGYFEYANDKRHHNSNIWKWASREEIALGAQLQMAILFIEAPKPKNHSRPGFSICCRIW